MVVTALVPTGKIVVPRLVRHLLNNAAVATGALKTPSSNPITLCAQNVLRRNIGTSAALFHINNKNRQCSRNANEAIATDDWMTNNEGPLLSDLRKRGLYSDYRYGHYHKYTIRDFSISEDKKNVTINWNDGHTSEFDAIWLRHNCHCKDCKHDTNGMVKIEWQSLPLDISVLSVEIEDDKMVEFKWATPDGKEVHKGVIPTATLRCYCYSDKSRMDRRKRRAMKFFEDKTIPKIEYEEFLSSDKGVHKCLTHVNDQGLCVVKNVPTNEKGFRKATGLIGPLQATMYGDKFEVVPTPNPINAAYSSNKLSLHMDLVFYETAPGLQILHCIKFHKDVVGGGNTFLDLHEVANKFRSEQPEFFDRLVKYPVTFNSIHYNRPVPVHMENQKTIFSLNHLGELVSVTYHPMVQGPTELSKDEMMSFYEAFTAFYRMISEYKSVYKFHFEDGDYLVFNNRRILHGRDAFTGSGRHLLGGYIELSDYHSYVQALHNKYGDGRLASRSGSHSWM